jgi:hypothetical protein
LISSTATILAGSGSATLGINVRQTCRRSLDESRNST